jgi:hypothetical protein
MQRTVAELPEAVPELCLIRLGFQIRRFTAFPLARRLARAIDRSAEEARAADAGLLLSERFRIAWNHFGVLQYWRGFDELEAWARREPHSSWWREAVERGRSREDFGLYHETFLVPRANIEAIYLDCRPVGLSAFGVPGEAVGSRTTSRDRLGRRASRGA